MSTYKDYGYTTAEESHTNSYIYHPLMKLLNPDINKCILDVGCGNGSLAIKLINNGYNVYGIDASTQGVKIAQRSFSHRFFIQDLTKDYIPSELSTINFDTIISTEVIEHLYDPRGYVNFCKNILIKNGGGQLIISTPYHGYLKNVVLALTGKMDAHHTVLWDGGHIKFWSRATLNTLLQEQGLRITNFVGCGRVPYLWKSMLIKAEI